MDKRSVLLWVGNAEHQRYQDFDDMEGKKIGLGLVINRESKSTMTAYVVFICLFIYNLCVNFISIHFKSALIFGIFYPKFFMKFL